MYGNVCDLHQKKKEKEKNTEEIVPFPRCLN